MAREIPLNQIGDYYRSSIDILARAATLEATKRLKRTTPVRVVYPGEPTGDYAEPVVYGTNLPRSWKNQYRTRQDTVPGFPDLIAKELEPWAKNEFNKILKR